jgi:DNA-binding SARP family transcriptional activator
MSDRAKIIEVMARGICRRRLDDNIVGDVSEDEIRAYVDETWRLFESDASAALTAYESHLQAKGLAVVPVEPTNAMLEPANMIEPIREWLDKGEYRKGEDHMAATERPDLYDPDYKKETEI